jgi:hypothetical protein
LDKGLLQAKDGSTFIKVVFIYENSEEKDYSFLKNIGNQQS